MPRKSILWALSILILFSLSCEIFYNTMDEAAGTGQDLNQTATALAGAQASLEAQRTADSITPTPQGEQATRDAQATATAGQRTQTVLDAGSTVTEAANVRLTATSETVQKATEQVGPLVEKIQKLVTEGIIPSAQGSFYQLDDFDQSWAQLGWYQWWDTGYAPENFVIMAHTYWDTASDKSNWNETGCGFVFAEQDEDNHDLIYLGLDGFARLITARKGDWRWLAEKRYGKVEIPSGEADMLLVVYSEHVYFYINDTLVIDVLDSLLVPGDLNLTLRSGTNKGFGTRCKMTQVNLWIAK